MELNKEKLEKALEKKIIFLEKKLNETKAKLEEIKKPIIGFKSFK